MRRCGQSDTQWPKHFVGHAEHSLRSWAVPEGIKAPLTGQALAETSDRRIEDPVVMPTALAAAKARAVPEGIKAPLAGQALKQILAHLQRKAESKEFNPLPESSTRRA